MDLLPGTLDMIVLRALSATAMHGYGIAQHIRVVSREALAVDEGSLYPALQRMRQKGWIKDEWGRTPNNQRARYYSITPAGRRQLGIEEQGFDEMVAVIRRLMKAT